MKQIELNLKKRLLIVEVPRLEDYEFINKDSKYLKVGNVEINLNIPTLSKLELICKGSELTEEIAKDFVHQSIHTDLFAHYVKDIPVNAYCYKKALESFSTGIKNAGYNIGENPVSLEREKHYRDFGNTFVADGILRSWQEADRRTFNPEKTLIFEILL